MSRPRRRRAEEPATLKLTRTPRMRPITEFMRLLDALHRGDSRLEQEALRALEEGGFKVVVHRSWRKGERE